MSSRTRPDPMARARAEAEQRYGRWAGDWQVTIGVFFASGFVCITLVTFLGMDTEEPRARMAITWTVGLVTLIAYLVERNLSKKKSKLTNELFSQYYAQDQQASSRHQG